MRVKQSEVLKMANSRSKQPVQEPVQKQSNFIARIIAVILALAVIVGAVCAFGYGSKNAAGQWFKNGDITTWFNSWGKGTKEPDETKKPEESSFLVRAQYTEGDLATFAATPYADDGNSVYLTLLTDPVETDDTFTWSSSDTSIVTVTPSDNGRSATVTCLQAFDEQITVKATSNETGLEAVATCDYVKRVQAVTLTVTPNTVKLGPTSNVYTVETDVTFGIGTITPELILSNGRFELNTPAGRVKKIYYSGGNDEDPTICTGELQAMSFTGNTFTVSDASSIMEFELVDPNFSKEVEQLRLLMIKELNELIKNFYNSYGMKTATVSTDYATTYGGKTYNTGAINATVTLDISALKIYSSQPSFDKPGIIF